MARTSQYWIVCVALMALLVAGSASAATLKAADEAAPTFAERVDGAKKLSLEQATKLKEHVDGWVDWASKRTKAWTSSGKDQVIAQKESTEGYTTKAAETIKKSTVDTHESVKGAFGKWKDWAQEKTGVASPPKKKNPVSDAINYVNSHIPGSPDKKDDEL